MSGIPWWRLKISCFPNYHVETRNEQVHGKGWTVWALVRQVTPRWAGHQQPDVPPWGYADEADPGQMAQKIAAAADHGIDAFIFDRYWYDGLSECCALATWHHGGGQ